MRLRISSDFFYYNYNVFSWNIQIFLSKDEINNLLEDVDLIALDDHLDCFLVNADVLGCHLTIDSECPNFKVVNNIVYSKDGTICYGGAEFGLSKQSVVKVADGCTKVIAGSFRGFMQKGSDAYILQRCPWYDPNEEICEYLVFPASVTYIGDRVCQYSKTNIVMLGTVPPTYVSYAFISSYNIYVPEEAVDTYKAASGWSGQTKRIKAITPEVLAAINS